MIALAAHPASGALVTALEWNEKCNGKTCGPAAAFGVVLMFAVLCGGVFLLLMSSFGALQAYLVSSVAFWGSWFVLAIIWFTGVPNVRIDYLPFIDKQIPVSTPRFLGPQGEEATWVAAPGSLATSITDWTPAKGTQRQTDIEAIKSAETAALDPIATFYAQKTGTDKAKITVPGVAAITNTEITRSGGRIKYIKFTTDKATAGPTATEEERAAISKITPSTFVLQYDAGTKGVQTLIALPLTFGLMVAHIFGLMWYERRHRPGAPTPTREREKVAV